MFDKNKLTYLLTYLLCSISRPVIMLNTLYILYNNIIILLHEYNY